jgi:hypothetical protein
MTEVLETLERIGPQLARSPYADRLLDLDAARAELLRLYEAGAIDAPSCRPVYSGSRRVLRRLAKPARS